MGSYLADTNVLLRVADPASEQHPVATQALARLLGQGDEVYLTPQNFIERFPLLPDSPEVFARWLELVKQCGWCANLGDG